MSRKVIQAYPIQAPTPPNKGEWFVVIVVRDGDGAVTHNAIAICSSKLDAQSVVEGLSLLYGC